MELTSDCLSLPSITFISTPLEVFQYKSNLSSSWQPFKYLKTAATSPECSLPQYLLSFLIQHCSSYNSSLSTDSAPGLLIWCPEGAQMCLDGEDQARAIPSLAWARFQALVGWRERLWEAWIQIPGLPLQCCVALGSGWMSLNLCFWVPAVKVITPTLEICCRSLGVWWLNSCLAPRKGSKLIFLNLFCSFEFSSPCPL